MNIVALSQSPMVQKRYRRSLVVVRIGYMVGSVLVAILALAMLSQPVRAYADPLDPQTLRGPQAIIDACVPIMEDTTWTTGNVYTATNCNVVVPVGVTLTVQPGVVVKFAGVSPGYASAEGSVALIVEGTLDVQGTAAAPVAFTSLTDDVHGGDTNVDGASSGSAGDWYGIVFQPGSVGRLAHFFVGYAGSGVFNATLGYGRAHIDVNAADVALRSGEVVSGTMKGIYLEGEGITPLIQSVHVADNVASDGRGYAIYQTSINMQPSYADLTFSGNDRDEVVIGDAGGSLNQDVVLGGANYGFNCGYTVCQLTVPAGFTLTVEPGTLLDFRSSYGIAVEDGGGLIAEGTATQPITFTSQRAASGDTGQHWYGLWAKHGSVLHLDHCDISYASDGNFGNGGLEINTDDAQVSNSHLHHNSGSGLYVYSRDGSTIHPTLTNVEITDNGATGVILETSAGSTTSLTWDGGGSQRNGWSGLASNTWGGSTINPTLRNLTIADNGTIGDNDSRRAGLYLHAHGVNPVLENLIITGNAGMALHWYCNGSITARNLTVSGNGLDELTMPGCDVSGGLRWDLADAGIPVRVANHVQVTTGGLLSIGAGTALHFDKNQYDSPTVLKWQTRLPFTRWAQPQNRSPSLGVLRNRGGGRALRSRIAPSWCCATATLATAAATTPTCTFASAFRPASRKLTFRTARSTILQRRAYTSI